MTDCISAPYAQMRDGYAKVLLNGRRELAHRVVYCQANKLALSDIAGKVVMHACDNPICVNPLHLVLGTQADNMADAIDKGRAKQNKPKFNAEQVAEIRAAAGSLKTLAQRYSTSISVISNILNHKGGYK